MWFFSTEPASKAQVAGTAFAYTRASGDPELLATPDAVAHGNRARIKLGFRRAFVIRSVAHLAAWTPFIYALMRALRDGWIPVSDSAVIALRSWDVLSAHGSLVGEATRLAAGAHDLGPLEFWLLTLPVHLHPAQGVLWGGAVWCMVAASLAIEAAWAVAGELGAVLASGIIAGLVAWSPGIAMVPVWNPWFGMMFFIAALATGWAVLSGRQKWWPALAITGSVATQAHLMYAIAAAGLVLLGFIAVMVDSFRPRRYRWAIIGIIAGLACWTAPLIQQFTARTGNITQLIGALRAPGTAQTGIGFGLKALSAATQPPVYWWKPSLTALKLSMILNRPTWFGIVQLGVTALVLIVAIFALRSRRAAALAALSLLTAAAALKTYSGIPAWNLSRPVTDLSYLMAPMFLIGVLAWLAAGFVLVLAIWQAMHWLGTRVTTQPPVSRLAGDIRKFTASWVPRIAGLAAIALVVVLTARAAAHIGGAYSYQNAARNAVRSAAAKIEREVSARRLALAVVAPRNIYQRQVTLGLIYALRSAGFAPEAHSWVSQLAPIYHYRGGSVIYVMVYAPKDGMKTRVVITRRDSPSSGCRKRGHERDIAGGSAAPGGCACGPRAEGDRSAVQSARAVHQRLRDQRVKNIRLVRGTPRTSRAARAPRGTHAQAQPYSASARLSRRRVPDEGAASAAAGPDYSPDSATGSDSSAAAAVISPKVAERRRPCGRAAVAC